jgi:prolyl-tRNA editing enzyme YbaK/EbsC (Cys-tRNA(Pro) deacylase)
MDPDLAKKDVIYFNPGKHDKSFRIKAWDLKKISKPKFI